MIEISRVDDRDCGNCKHYKPIYIDKDKTLIIGFSCEHWNCDFKPKEIADEQTAEEKGI